MKAFLGKVGGRKFVTLILELLFCVAVGFGLDLDKDTKLKIMELSVWAVGIYMGSQGIADGLSGGKTSTVAQVDPERVDAGK